MHKKLVTPLVDPNDLYSLIVQHRRSTDEAHYLATVVVTNPNRFAVIVGAGPLNAHTAVNPDRWDLLPGDSITLIGNEIFVQRKDEEFQVQFLTC